MCWRKRGLWIVSLTITGMLLLLTLGIWIPVPTVDAYEATSRTIISGRIALQTTPTEDATVTALGKEKLTQEVKQLKNQNEPDLFGRVQTNAVLLSTLVVVIGGLIGLFRWGADRRREREKRAEESFQAAVTGLGDDNELTRINATILLRNFLHPGYERFSTQIFELAVAHLRLPRTSGSPAGPNVPLPLTPLGQKLTVIFIEAFPLARKVNKRSPRPLDATGIQLDNAHLEKVDLRQVRMPRAFLRRAKLRGADLSGADLREADLSGADLREANLRNANLSGSDLSGALLSGTKLNGANLSSTCLKGASLSFADLSEANLRGAYLSDTKFERAKFTRANLSEAYLYRIDSTEVDLKQAILREASLSNTHLVNANLSGADLTEASFDEVNFKGANLRYANFWTAQFSRANRSDTELCEVYLWLLGLSEAALVGLSQADPKRINLSEDDLQWIKERQADRQWVETCDAYLQRANATNTKTTNIEDALILEKTNLSFVWGLTQEQLEASEAKGAMTSNNPLPRVPRDHDMQTVLEQLVKDVAIPVLSNEDANIPLRPGGILGPRRTFGGILRISSNVRYMSGEHTVKYMMRSRYSLFWRLLRSIVPLLLLILFSIFVPNAFSLPSSLRLYWWIGPSVGILGLLVVVGIIYRNYLDDVFIFSTRRIAHFQNKFSVEYRNIRSVTAPTTKITVSTILERLLDVGNIDIETTSYPPHITFRAVDHPFVIWAEILALKNFKRRQDAVKKANSQKKNLHVWFTTVLARLEKTTKGASMPDLHEKDLLTALTDMQEFGLDVVVWGEAEPSMDLPSGYVVHQDPPPKTRLEQGIEVVLGKRPAPIKQTQ